MPHSYVFYNYQAVDLSSLVTWVWCLIAVPSSAHKRLYQCHITMPFLWIWINLSALRPSYDFMQYCSIQKSPSMPPPTQKWWLSERFKLTWPLKLNPDRGLLHKHKRNPTRKWPTFSAADYVHIALQILIPGSKYPKTRKIQHVGKPRQKHSVPDDIFPQIWRHFYSQRCRVTQSANAAGRTTMRYLPSS